MGWYRENTEEKNNVNDEVCLEDMERELEIEPTEICSNDINDNALSLCYLNRYIIFKFKIITSFTIILRIIA